MIFKFFFYCIRCFTNNAYKRYIQLPLYYKWVSIINVRITTKFNQSLGYIIYLNVQNYKADAPDARFLS